MCQTRTVAGPTHVPTSIVASARRIGASRWIEEQLFEILGTWVQSTPQAEAKIVFARLSRHAAWRAAQWSAIQSEIEAFDAAVTTLPASPDVAELCDGLRAAVSAAERVEALRSLVLPALAESYAAHERLLDLASGGPARRTLARVRLDLALDQADLDALGDEPDDEARGFVERLGTLCHAATDLTASSD